MSVPVRTQILPLAYALKYCVCTYMLYGLSRVEALTAITFPILVTVKLTPNIRANALPITVLNTD